LDYLTISYLYSVYPMLKPGQLTDLRSVLVNNKAFANVAVDLSFYKYLIYDSSALTKSINTYVDWIKTGAQEGSLIDGPNYSKVEIVQTFVHFCFGLVISLLTCHYVAPYRGFTLKFLENMSSSVDIIVFAMSN
jgi:endoribonuclease Dicer